MAHPQPHYPQKKQFPFRKNLQEIKQQIDVILEEMKRNPDYVPKRVEIDLFSKKALELVQKNHPLVSPDHKNLLIAIIDLTEIPVMHPKMQRIAFEIALKDASNNINKFLLENP